MRARTRFRSAAASGARRVGRQVAVAGDIDGKADQHADAGGAEAPVPAGFFAQRADDERRGDDPGVDAEVEDLESVGAAVVVVGIKAADLTGDIALEQAGADDEAEEAEQEGRLDRHQEMAGGHGDGAQQHGAPAAEDAVGDKAAQNRRDGDVGSVGAEDDGRQRLALEAAEQALQRPDSPDMVELPWQQQIFHHVENEQRLHAVEGKAFEAFRKGQIAKALRVAEKGAVAGRRRAFGCRLVVQGCFPRPSGLVASRRPGVLP